MFMFIWLCGCIFMELYSIKLLLIRKFFMNTILHFVSFFNMLTVNTCILLFMAGLIGCSWNKGCLNSTVVRQYEDY